MPKLTKQTPNFRLHRLSGQAFVELDGKRHYLGRYDDPKSKANYDQLVGTWLANGRSLPDQTSRLTLVELMAAYLRWATSYYVKNGKPTPQVGVIKAMIRAIRTKYGTVPVRQFGPNILRNIQEELIQLGWCRNYINKQIGVLRRMFKWAVSRELVEPAVYQALTSVSGLAKGRTQARETSPIRPVDDAVVDKTIEKLSSVVRDMVRLQRLTGARPSEICSLRPCDVELSEPAWTYRPSAHKTEHSGFERTIFFGPKAQAILKPYLERSPEQFCFSPKEARLEMQRKRQKNPKNPELSKRQLEPKAQKRKRVPGVKYDTNSYRRAIHRACDLAFPFPPALNLRLVGEWRRSHRWSPNRLRHTAASVFRKEFGIDATRTVLGHRSMDTTAIYAETDLKTAAEVICRLG